MAKKKIVRRRLADGTVKEYEYPVKVSNLYTVGDLIVDYLKSSDFETKKPNTQALYRITLDKIRDLSNVPVADIRRRHVLNMREKFKGKPGTANMVVAMWRVLLRYAWDREHVLANVAVDIRPLPIGEYRRWSNEQIAYALAHFPNPARRAAIVGLYTGQRVGDCSRMMRSDYDGEGIRVVQEKTGKKLWIAAHKDLRDELDQPSNSLYLIHKADGGPFKSRSLSQLFNLECRRHPALADLVFHGLRKAACSRLAEAGCTEHEISSITGQSLTTVVHYTREVRQEHNARAAIVKLEQHTNGIRKTTKTEIDK